jgi:hypothetical protein
MLDERFHGQLSFVWNSSLATKMGDNEKGLHTKKPEQRMLRHRSGE